MSVGIDVAGRETSMRLSALAAIAEEIGADRVARDVADLAGRLGQGRFFVACVGQFKRGKSTLVNALLERPVVPTGVVPVTTAVTILRHGADLAASVQFDDGRRVEVDPAALADYVSEARNPGNRKGVVAVEVTVPSPLLASGLCLVDTPGLGSVFAANAATTRAFVPHIDAALVVLGTDPPISGDELALVEEVGQEIGHLVFVLNKSDRVPEAESVEAASFTRQVVAARLDREVGDILRVSAAERLAGHATRDWTRLEDALKDLARQSAVVLDEAASRGALRAARALARDLDEQRDALIRPLEESERRLAVLRATIADAGIALRELAARLRVEQVALASRFGQLRQAFLASEVPAGGRDLAGAVRDAPARPGPACRAAAMDLARDEARRRVVRWAREIEPQAEAMYSETMRRFVRLANDFVTRLSSASSDRAALNQEEVFVERGFREDTHFFFTSLLALTAPGFWVWILDWVWPRRLRVASSIRHASRYLERLMTTNSARVANDLAGRVEESQHRVGSEIRSRLSALVATAERALERARVQQAAGSGAVQAELAKIDHWREQVSRAAGQTAR